MIEDAVIPPLAHIRAALLREPVYVEDGALWTKLLQSRRECLEWFAGVGLDLVIDEEEGYAFIRQPEPVEGTNGPKLIVRRKLGYEPTLLLACLRQELARTEARDADQVRLVRTRREIAELVSGFLGQTTDEIRDLKKIDRSIEQLCDLGFLKKLGGEAGDDFEIRRIIKARLGASELEEIKRKLQDHVGD